MFSKYARVTSLASKCLNFNSISTPQRPQQSLKVAFEAQSIRLMSKSIADEILKAKEQEQKEKEKAEEPKGKKEYKPLTKWQKIGFYTAGVGAPIYFIVMAYLFCKFTKYTLGQESSIYPKIDILKTLLFTKFTFSKSRF